MYRRRGFTLVEVLVVIAIIGILMGILMPAIARARASANRTRCAAQLQDIGRMFQMYLSENRNTLPRLNPMPSFRPPLNASPGFAQLLSAYHRGGERVFQCPADRITQPAVGAPSGYATYFDREGASYRWNAFLNLRAARITDLRSPAALPLTDEYEPFHGRAGVAGSMNHLFADLHVADTADTNLVIIVATKDK